MKGVNRVILVGALGADPEIRHTAGGSAITTIKIATSESWRDKTSGENVEKTEWHRVTFFNKLAEIAGEYLKKGRQVYVEGKLSTRKYVDKDGIERYATDIIADEMQMLGNNPNSAPSQTQPQRQQTAQRSTQNTPPPDDFDSGIPF